MAGTDDNEGPEPKAGDPTSGETLSPSEEAAVHGITCVMVEHFEYSGYRYTHLKDAIAEAKRRGARPRS